MAEATSTASASPRYVSDLDQFRQELASVGAVKFYEVTEELLRAAQFERALLRYRLLKGQLAGQSAYSGLMVQIEHRLRFLQQQLHLTSQEIGPLSRPKPSRVRRRPGKTSVAPTAPAVAAERVPTDKAAAPAPAAPTPSNASAAETASASPETAAATAPPAPESQEQKPDTPAAAADKPQETKPATSPPSTWDKVRAKLKKLPFFRNNKEKSG